ncbi:MAG TPA: RNA polymerase sigma factor [Bacteroidales bacterium]|nr:RNA polymerase sigma factor [Bacteroidales bacterium]HPK29658.1 RNA polymerase sigma factor [Bacteroidales bacterium]
MTQKEIKKFYDTHYRRLFNASYRIVGNGADAEEIMHDTLLRFLEMENPPKEPAQISAWLIRTCIRRSIDRLRVIKREMSFKENYEEPESISAEESEEMEISTREEVKRVKEALQTMKDPYRLVLTLSLVEGMDYQEIAEITGQKEVTIRSQVSRGKAALLKILQNERN